MPSAPSKPKAQGALAFQFIRERMGLDLGAFADFVRTPVEELAAWEAGAATPSQEAMQRMLDALGLRPRDLKDHSRAGWPLADVLFLSTQGAPSLEQLRDNRSLTTLMDFRRAVFDLSELESNASSAGNSVPSMAAPYSTGGVPFAADRMASMAREWLGAPANRAFSLLPLLRAKGVAVFLSSTELSGIDGASMKQPRPAVLVCARKPAKRRFVLAHELCHLLFDLDDRETFVSRPSLDQYSDTPYDQREQRADAFAAHLLAPSAAVKACLSGDVTDEANVIRVGQTFGLSRTAAINRIVHEFVPLDVRDIVHARMLNGQAGSWAPLIQENFAGGPFLSPLFDPVRRALRDGEITRVRARELLQLGPRDSIPGEPSEVSSPLRTAEDDACMAACRWLLDHPEVRAVVASSPRWESDHWIVDLDGTPHRSLKVSRNMTVEIFHNS